MTKKRKGEVSRRGFIQGTGATLAVAAVASPAAVPLQSPAVSPPPSRPKRTISVTVNGRRRRVAVEDRWTLVEVLRDHLQLTGTKIGCDRGECGACTVLLDGVAVYACSQLAVWSDGRSVDTVEGLASNGRLDPLQQSFIDHDAPQCGFCTSGQLMAAKGLLAVNPRPSAAEVKAAMVGNLCRCSNYNSYVEAVVAVASRTTSDGSAAADASPASVGGGNANE